MSTYKKKQPNIKMGKNPEQLSCNRICPLSHLFYEKNAYFIIKKKMNYLQ